MGLLSKVAKFTGSLLNDTTGVSTSAKQQYQHQLALQKDAQEFSKWQMANAHQMEVQDLKNAGLNPVLSAGAGGGASAGVSMGSTSAGTGADPMAMIGQIVNMSNSVKQTENAIKKTEADIINETEMTQANVAKALAEAGYKQKEIDFYLEHGVFPGATVKTGLNGHLGLKGAGGGVYSDIPVGLKGITEKPSTKKKANSGRALEDWSHIFK